MYKLHIFTPEGGVESYPYESKPTFEDMYAKIGCDMIQPSTAYLPKYSNRKDGYVEFWMDEEFLMKHPVPNVNKGMTSAWYDWQRKTGHQALPGSKIHGKVAVIQKLKDKEEEAKQKYAENPTITFSMKDGKLDIEGNPFNKN